MIKLMPIITFLLLVAFNVCVTAGQTVYKSVDKDGNVVFTDLPTANSEKITVRELQTIKNTNPPKPRSAVTSTKPAEENNRYSYIRVTNPADGAGIRQNEGNVNIAVAVGPPLRRGHKVVMRLNGKQISSGTATSILLNNVDRGTHSISAAVVDADGKQLISTTSSFSLLRAFIKPQPQAQAQAKPKAKPKPKAP